MKTYKWTCSGCETPNLFVHNESIEGQVSLNCNNCGTPGKFEPIRKTVYQALTGDTCATFAIPSHLDSARSIAQFGSPRLYVPDDEWSRDD